MQTISSTQNLVPLIEDLSRSLAAIASILKTDMQTAAAAEKTKKEAEATTFPEQVKQQEELVQQKNAVAESSAGSSKSRKPTITKEQIRAVLAEKSQAGLTEKVKALITSYGAKNLSDIDPSNYEELLAAAKALE